MSRETNLGQKLGTLDRAFEGTVLCPWEAGISQQVLRQGLVALANELLYDIPPQAQWLRTTVTIYLLMILGVDDLDWSLLGSLTCSEPAASCTCLVVVGAGCRLHGLGESQLGQLVSTLCGFSDFRGLDPAPSPGRSWGCPRRKAEAARPVEA